MAALHGETATVTRTSSQYSIDLSYPFKWLFFYSASRTVELVLRFEKCWSRDQNSCSRAAKVQPGAKCNVNPHLFSSSWELWRPFRLRPFTGMDLIVAKCIECRRHPLSLQALNTLARQSWWSAKNCFNERNVRYAGSCHNTEHRPRVSQEKQQSCSGLSLLVDAVNLINDRNFTGFFFVFTFCLFFTLSSALEVLTFLCSEWVSEAITLSPQGFSGLIYNVFRRTLARLLITQFTILF